MKKRLKAFSVETSSKFGKLIFLTKAKNGREALKSMVSKSCDFNKLMGQTESNNITIKVEHHKTRGEKNVKQK